MIGSFRHLSYSFNPTNRAYLLAENQPSHTLSGMPTKNQKWRQNDQNGEIVSSRSKTNILESLPGSSPPKFRTIADFTYNLRRKMAHNELQEKPSTIHKMPVG